MGKKHWVKKGTNTKGRKKTGRTRRVKKARKDMDITVHIPHGGRIPIPDRVTLQFKKNMKFIADAGVGLLAAAQTGNAYFDVVANGIYEPFHTDGLTPVWGGNVAQSFEAALADAGFHANIVSTAALTDNPAGYSKWISTSSSSATGMYNQYFVKKASIKVTVDPQNIADDGTLTITPCASFDGLVGTLPVSYNEAQCTKQTKEKEVYTNNPRSNTLSHSINIHDMFGFTSKEYDAAGAIAGGYSYSGSYNTIPNNSVVWHVMYQTNDGLVTSAKLAVEVDVIYDVVLFSPNLTGIV